VRLTGMKIHNQDRLLGLMFEGKEGGTELLLSLMGPRSNVYALDAEGKLLAAMRPLAQTRSELHIGQAWTNPDKKTDLSTTNRWPGLEATALLAAVASHYAKLESEHEQEHLASRLRQAIRRELDFATRKEANLQRDLAEAKQARENKMLGELLKTVLHSVKPGDTKAVANDFETGAEVEIALDPTLTPAQNLDRYFKSYHKGLVGTNMLGQQLEITQSHAAELRELMAELDACRDLEALRDFAARPAVRNLYRKHFPDEGRTRNVRPPKKKPQKKEVPARLLPKRYVTSDGLEVWVGRSDEGNDYLTTKLANGNDLFFHVEGYPGSHTILRLDGKKDPPQESLLEASELAVQFSKMKDATKATIHIAPIKHVHKPKDAKPGLVYVNKGSTLQLRRDPKRLERILNARVKE
jgi:predicted ribosome quality control (RQC) complex YloA/Tae2 family protein